MTQPSLFEPSLPQPAKPERVDFWNLIARERGMPEGWRWFRLQTVDHRLPREQGAASVTGATCSVTFKSGPRKGQLNWAKRDKHTERTLVITFKELDERIAKWEADTGRCADCFGSGNDPWGRCRKCGDRGAPRAEGEG